MNRLPKLTQTSTTASRKCDCGKDHAETNSWSAHHDTAHEAHEISVNTKETQFSKGTKLVRDWDATRKFLVSLSNREARLKKARTKTNADGNNGNEDEEALTKEKISQAKVHAMKKNSKRTNLVQIHGNLPLPINAIQWTQNKSMR